MRRDHLEAPLSHLNLNQSRDSILPAVVADKILNNLGEVIWGFLLRQKAQGIGVQGLAPLDSWSESCRSSQYTVFV
jgi:hypothetical protein